MDSGPSDAFFGTVALIIPVLFFAGVTETRFSLTARPAGEPVQERPWTTRKRVAALVFFLGAGFVGEAACLTALWQGGTHSVLGLAGLSAAACQALLLSVLLAQRATDDLQLTDVQTKVRKWLVSAAVSVAGVLVSATVILFVSYVVARIIEAL
jgi:hypothetical protein